MLISNILPKEAREKLIKAADTHNTENVDAAIRWVRENYPQFYKEPPASKIILWRPSWS